MATRREKKPPELEAAEALAANPLEGRMLRREMMICHEAKEVLASCRYTSRTRLEVSVIPSPINFLRAAHVREATYLQAGLAAPLDWLRRLHNQHISAVAGHFIFQLIEELDRDTLAVIAARENSYGRLVTAPALLERTTVQTSFEINWGLVPDRIKREHRPPTKALINACYELVAPVIYGALPGSASDDPFTDF